MKTIKLFFLNIVCLMALSVSAQTPESSVNISAAPAGDGQPCPGAPTLTDIDGNIYNTVQIGSQCWMKENLRTTKYADGTSISRGRISSNTTAYWYYPNNSSSNKAKYGLLYNWKAVMRNSSSSSAKPSGVKGICPTGWHVPSSGEWNILTNYVSRRSEYICGGHNTWIAMALSDSTGWTAYTDSQKFGWGFTCCVGERTSSNNATGFSALPAGAYDGPRYSYFGNTAYFWTTTAAYGETAFYRNLSFNYKDVNAGNHDRFSGFSVRCVKD